MSSTLLSPDYVPSDDEEFMNERMLAFFRARLQDWRADLLRETGQTIQNLQEDTRREPDLGDRASVERDRAFELRTRDRARKLIAKIGAALGRIEDGSYGYCTENGEPIGLRRLMARPIATMTLPAQERHERMERMRRSD